MGHNTICLNCFEEQSDHNKRCSCGRETFLGKSSINADKMRIFLEQDPSIADDKVTIIELKKDLEDTKFALAEWKEKCRKSMQTYHSLVDIAKLRFECQETKITESEKPHDLLKNNNDIPDNSRNVLILRRLGKTEIDYYNHKTNAWASSGNDVISWQELPRWENKV